MDSIGACPSCGGQFRAYSGRVGKRGWMRWDCQGCGSFFQQSAEQVRMQQ